MSEKIYKFQELIRINDATIGVLDNKNLVNGKTALSLIECYANLPIYKILLPRQYQIYIEEQIEEAKISGELKENVRAQVKNILMYPELKYEPWENVDFDTSIIDVSNIRFKIELVDGKVYAKCLSKPSLSDILYEKFTTQEKLSPNPEACHITFVNSNVVYEIKSEKISQFIEAIYSDDITDITIGNIKTTV